MLSGPRETVRKHLASVQRRTTLSLKLAWLDDANRDPRFTTHCGHCNREHARDVTGHGGRGHYFQCPPDTRVFARALSAGGTTVFVYVTTGGENAALVQAASLLQVGVRAMENAIAADRTFVPNRHDAIVRRVLSYLDENFTGPVHLNDCARQVALNPVYLSTLFSRTVGVGFKQYVIALRIAKARELLTDCTRRVSEVAYAVGYSCPNRFLQAFRKATGVSPSEWRVSSHASEETTRKLKFREGGTDQRHRH